MARQHIFLASLLAFVLTGCRSTTPKVETADDRRSTTEAPDETRLTQQGRNSQPRFSPDGQHILFVSEQRPQHQHPQIYTMVLKSKKDRRVTFQDGVNASPVFHPKGNLIFYASSTDEEKENSAYIRRVLAEMNGKAKDDPHGNESPATEIYVSHLSGHSIERLSRRPGFDGHPAPIGNGDHLVITTMINGKLTLAKLLNGKVVPLVSDDADNLQAAVSPKGNEMVWVRKPRNGDPSQLMISDLNGKNARPLHKAPSAQGDPTWHANGEHILFSSDAADKNFEIFAIKKDGTCLQRLTKSPEADRQPAVSPQGDRLIFARQTAQSSHLIAKSLTLPQTCSEKTIE